MSTLNGSSSGNATSTAPSILSLEMQLWSFKTVASMRASPWTYRRTPLRPKTERTQIRTQASPSTGAGYWQPQILLPTNRSTGLIWAVHGNSTHGRSTCNLTLGTTYTQLGGLSGIQHLPWTHCTMENTWTMGRAARSASGSSGLVTGSSQHLKRPVSSQWGSSYSGPLGCHQRASPLRQVYHFKIRCIGNGCWVMGSFVLW